MQVVGPAVSLTLLIHTMIQVLLAHSCLSANGASAFTLVMMGARRGKGSLQRSLEDTNPNSASNKIKKSSSSSSKSKRGAMNALNGGKGQEITGVTLPAPGTIKGWEFGGGVRIACANVEGDLYAVQGDCPRCAFDLFKGDLLVDATVWGEDVPRVACPTCSTTYGFRSGKHGPPLKRTGFLSSMVGNLAMTATKADEYKDARAFKITRDDDGRVFCKDLF